MSAPFFYTNLTIRCKFQEFFNQHLKMDNKIIDELKKTKTIKKLNLGCGNRKIKGYVNVDSNPYVNPDLICDVFNLPLPFQTETVDEVYTRHLIEHLPQQMFVPWMEELWRILKPNGIIKIIAPHASSMYGYGCPFHYWCPSLNTFSYFEEQTKPTGERYSKIRFEVIKQQLIFWGSNDKMWLASKLMTPFNWMCHGSLVWQMFIQRFNPLGFDEIHFELRKIRDVNALLS